MAQDYNLIVEIMKDGPGYLFRAVDDQGFRTPNCPADTVGDAMEDAGRIWSWNMIAFVGVN